jgi:hypothetical protein
MSQRDVPQGLWDLSSTERDQISVSVIIFII